MLKILSILTFIATFFCAIDAQVSNEKLRDELLKMQSEDQKARENCAKGNVGEQIRCYAEISEKIDKPNSKRLNEIYEKSGFPAIKTVGREGVAAFMLILQHTPDENLRQKMLKPIKKAFERKELSASEYANYVDRLLVHQGKPQIYGSNFDFKDGKLLMSKVKNLKNLDEIRRKIGLPTIAEYIKILKEIYNLEVEVPEFPR